MNEETSAFMESLSPELREKAAKCTNTNEILALAREEKIALPDEVLEAVAGGAGQQNSCTEDCPNCGKTLNYRMGHYACDCGYYR